MKRYLPTGNEMISLPTINEETAGLESVSFLSMTYKGMIELRGSECMPLIQPFVQKRNADGAYSELPLTNAVWHREHNWIPSLCASIGDANIKMSILAPVEERGFAIHLSVCSEKPVDLRIGLRGRWDSVWHCINEDKELEGTKHCYESGWNRSIVFDYRCGCSIFAFAPMADREIESSFRQEGSGICYTLSREILCSGTETITFFWGLGFEEVAAATSAKEMLRRSWQWEYQKTADWLDARACSMPTKKLSEIYNTNLFFCLFYATGITLDTEEFVCATSRSSRYYVSAAYWDRDSLLWAFPAILDADKEQAKKVLLYAFGRQRRNLGIHSRYIDGTVLEPGFELDELMAPILALTMYVTATGDKSLLQKECIREGVDEIIKKLSSMKHPEIDLYETFLQPTDDERVYPYLTYDNVLVWRAMRDLADILPEKYGFCSLIAEKVKKAIMENCIFADKDGKAYFGWSVDLEGHHDVYDEPPGSLQLLPYYGFCSMDDGVWKNTVQMIRSPSYPYSFAGRRIAEIGCPHAPYPWILSLSNSLLCGHANQAWKELEQLEMDNGIACESVDPDQGTCTTGAAFATCAGFLCHSMKIAGKEMQQCETT